MFRRHLLIHKHKQRIHVARVPLLHRAHTYLELAVLHLELLDEVDFGLLVDDVEKAAALRADFLRQLHDLLELAVEGGVAFELAEFLALAQTDELLAKLLHGLAGLALLEMEAKYTTRLSPRLPGLKS